MGFRVRAGREGRGMGPRMREDNGWGDSFFSVVESKGGFGEGVGMGVFMGGR